MMEKIKKIKALLVLLLSVAIHVDAQRDAYLWQAPLQGLRGEGYYRLLLSPDVRARASADGSDLRIVDSSGDYVPYLLRMEAPVSKGQDVTLLPVKSTADTKTETIIIENKEALTLSQLILTLRNKAQSTAVQLSGSDDSQQWFDINSDIVLSPSSEMHADTFDQQISFPPVRYKELRLIVKVYKSIPVNIIRVSVQKPILTSGRYSAIPLPTIVQCDSAKKSYITIDYKEAYTIDRLIANVSGPRLYHRQILIYSRDTATWAPIGNGMLSSQGSNDIVINARAKHLLIVIDNGDDKALHVDSVLSLQLNNYLIGYLDADRNYFVVFGNPKVGKPNYDIAYFEDSIRNKELKEISCGPIGANTIIPSTEPAKKASAKGLSKWWIWPVLIGVLSLLLFFTFRVSRDINSKP